MSKRHLGGPIFSWKEPDPAGPAVNSPGIDVPAVFVWFPSVESTCFESELSVTDPGCNHLIRNMRGILPVMGERSLRKFHRRCPMRIGDRTERRVAHRRIADVKKRVLVHRSGVLKVDRHKEIVRVLPVDYGLSERALTRLEQEGIPPVGHRGWLQAR